MPDVDGTCEYVLDPDDPETWGSEEGDECYVDEDLLNEDGVWTCPHDAEEGEDLCIFHLPIEKKDDEVVVDAFLDAIDETTSNDDSDTQERKLQFLGATFGEFNLNSEVVVKNRNIIMTHAEISGKLDWSNSLFDISAIHSHGLRCVQNADFSSVDFSGDTDFSNAEFGGDVKFGWTNFTGDAVFNRVGFSGDTDFSNAEFGGEVKFGWANFTGDAVFSRANFTEDGDFTFAEFGQRPNFGSTKFGGGAHFGKVKFCRGAFFEKADFSGDAEFSDVEFGGEASFRQAEFNDVKFRDVTFDGDTDFSHTELSSANFRGAELTGDINFRQATFDGSVDFSQTDCSDANFEGATIPDVDFAETHLENSDFEKANLSGANLEGAKLTNSDLFGAELSGAQIYGTRIGDVAINTETTLDEYGKYRCVYDPNSEYEYDPDDEEKVGQLRKAMGAYHVLEQLTRANTLPDEQAKFFARRQDMRRAQLREDGRHLNYWFAEAQNAIFRHGESFSRVVGWSVGTIVAFAFIFPAGGWLQSESTGTLTYGAIADSPELMWQSFYHSTLLFLTGNGPLAPTGFIGEVLTTIEALIAPILLALLIFVLGRRAAR